MANIKELSANNTVYDIIGKGTENKNASSSSKVKYDWVGTLEEYETQQIETTHPEWVCYIIDDVDVSLANLKKQFPIGSAYLTFNLVCPLAELFGTWQLVGQGIVTSVSNTASVQGNGMTLGMTNGTYTGGLQTNTSGTTGIRQEIYGKDVGTAGGASFTDGTSWGITTDPTKSGMIANVSSQTLQLNIFRRVA